MINDLEKIFFEIKSLSYEIYQTDCFEANFLPFDLIKKEVDGRFGVLS